MTANKIMKNIPNSNEENKENATITNIEQANSLENQEGTEQKETVVNPIQEAEPEIDYKKKFSESSQEALRILEENKKLKAELELKGNQEQIIDENQEFDNTDNLYPGFENLTEIEQQNLIEYSKNIAKKAKEDIYKDPAIAFAKSSYNEKVWNDAFNNVKEKYPSLKDSEDEFKAKYYNVNNVPSNIESILEDVAKIHLFDKAKSIGAKETKEKLSHSGTERANAGDKVISSGKTLEEWNRIAKENPQKFAKLSKQFNEDLKSGKI